jgi:methionine sulfoxide reductase catalytic subunit
MAGIRPGLAHHPIETSLSSADSHVCLNHWLPPRAGVVPKIRIGQHWIDVLWALPRFVLLVIGVAIAQELRQIPAVEAANN